MTEFTEQRTLIAWFRATYPKYEKCIRLSLSGVNLPFGPKAARMINQFKSQGWVKGESDLFFAIPNLTFHGLFIEIKNFDKKATPEQLDYIEVMLNLGYQALVIEGAEAAQQAITDYMTTAFIIH